MAGDYTVLGTWRPLFPLLEVPSIQAPASKSPSEQKREAHRKDAVLPPPLQSPAMGLFSFLRHLATPAPPAKEHPELLARLEELGFFRYSSPETVEEERTAVLRQGWSGIFGEVGRLFHADAEDLTEGGFGGLVEEIQPFLAGQGVTVPALEEEFDERGYTVVAGGERFPMWTLAELEREQAGEPGLSWGLSAARAFGLVNRWLQEAGSAERAYAVGGGNDLSLFFFTEELHAFVAGHPDASRPDIPYVPELVWPMFGQTE